MGELFNWSARVEAVEPWKPRPVDHANWPPDYRAVYAWRLIQVNQIKRDPALRIGCLHYYSTRPAEFIMHWCDTYDPRAKQKWMPFVFFKKQDDFIAYIEALVNDKERGLVEKARDMGVTWLCCAYSVWRWLFVREDAIGWGSRKQDLVDRIGDPDSIFEKIRLILRRLPRFFLPSTFDFRKHATFMKLLNPENGSIIAGEAGDSIGRGGRKTMVFVDEAAHLERPELTESALGDNTNVQIDISSVNGLGNVFHRRRENGVDWVRGKPMPPGFVRVFVADWRDHPAKTQEWYDQRKAKYIREGMEHIFAQEVDRNYSAAVQNTIIRTEWINAAVDAHLKIRWRDVSGNVHVGLTPEQLGGRWVGGLDVADEGMDRNAATARQGIVWRLADEWGERDPGITTRRTVAMFRELKGIAVQYDSIGVGAAVKTEYNRLIDENIISRAQISFTPWNAGAPPLDPYFRVIPDDPDSLLNKDMYQNIKAQAWFSIRTRFYKTWANIVNGEFYPVAEMISLDSAMSLLHQVKKELAQPTHKPSGSMKTMVDKKPDGTKSPNLGDAGIMMFHPIMDTSNAIVGR